MKKLQPQVVKNVRLVRQGPPPGAPKVRGNKAVNGYGAIEFDAEGARRLQVAMAMAHPPEILRDSELDWAWRRLGEEKLRLRQRPGAITIDPDSGDLAFAPGLLDQLRPLNERMDALIAEIKSRQVGYYKRQGAVRA